MDRTGKGRSARWGAACAPCAAAKTRCIRTQSRGLPCDRCRSLERHCSDQNPGPRKKRQAKSSRTAPLAEGLDNLNGSLGTLGDEGSTTHGSSFNSSPEYRANSNCASSIGYGPQAQDKLSQEDTPLHTSPYEFTSSAPARPICTCMATVGKEDLVPVESDETLLSIYKNQLSSRLPFVIIPPGTTAKQLHATRPFLMKVIRMVASVRHLRSMRGQSRAVMEHLSHAMLVRSERSLDLLQGILVFLGFYHYHCLTHSQFNNLTRLAVSLLEDMGLNRRLKSEQITSQLPLLRVKESTCRTNEEKRTLLGVWYISSNAALVVKQLTVTKYTNYLDECLKELEEAREYKTDQLAVELVRVQRITEEICQFHSRDCLVDGRLGSSRALTTARLDEYQVALDRLRDALPQKLKSDHLLSCYYDSACLRLFGPLLAGSHLPDAESESFASLSLSGVLISDILSRFTVALKAWLDDWLAVPVCSYFYMPQSAYAQAVHAATMITRWVRVAGPGAVKLCRASAPMSCKASTAPSHTTPALSGVPSCPDLSLPTAPVSVSTQVVSAEILDTLRAQVVSHPSLQIDICGILDMMAARFVAAKEEMVAGQGVDWENDTWDIAAEHLKMKKVRIEKWQEIVAIAAGEGRNYLNNSDDNVYEGGRETMNMSTESSIEGFEWLTSGYDQDNLHWESAIFDEIMRDIHP